jgi:hypothetical protein
MDPLSATSPDELRDSCAASAYRVARRVQGWDAAEPVVRSALDAGLAVLDHVTSADLEAVTA